jgi:hypothetical protein
VVVGVGVGVALVGGGVGAAELVAGGAEALVEVGGGATELDVVGGGVSVLVTVGAGAADDVVGVVIEPEGWNCTSTKYEEACQVLLGKALLPYVKTPEVPRM